MSHEYVPRLIKPERGEYYYGVKCPQTGKVLAFDEDSSKGTRPHAPVQRVFLSCHHCQSNHLLKESDIFSFCSDGSEG